MRQTALIVFIKNFLPGKVKTRLAKSLGDEKALEIYRQLAVFTIEEVKKTTFPAYFYFSEFSDAGFLKSNGVDFGTGLYQSRLQFGRDLGSRMKNAMEEVLADHYSALILGTDCPGFNHHAILDSLVLLTDDDVDAVIGPAQDGGYYGLGMKQSFDLFSGIPWSSDQVFTQTISKMDELKLHYRLLPVVADIDYELDWNNFMEDASVSYFKEVIRSSSLANDVTRGL